MTWTDAAAPFAGAVQGEALARAHVAERRVAEKAPLALRGVSLAFGGVSALREVDTLRWAIDKSPGDFAVQTARAHAAVANLA